MTTKRIIDYDPMTGISTWFEYIPESDLTIISRLQDVEGILELNKAMAKDTDYTKQGFKDGWWHYASIPNVLIEKWKTEHNIDVYKKEDWPAVFKKLNDPEYRYLKTTAKWHW